VTTRAAPFLAALATVTFIAGCSSGDDDDGSGAVSAAPATAAGGPTASGGPAAPPDQPAISGHGQVIAQQVLELSGDERQWRVASATLPPGDPPAPLPDPITIVLADAGTVEVVEPDRTSRLGPGEAAVLAEGSGATATASGPDTPVVWTIELLGGADDGLVGEPFAPTAGANDVELHRDVLAPGELLPMTTHGVPALVLVTAGAVEVAAEGTTVPLTAGTADTFSGDMAITNNGAADFAAVVVATLTPPEGAAPPPPVSTAPPVTEAGGTTTPPSVAPTTPPDRDEDGLGDAEEEELGTDPDNPDSEGDHVDDGDEVHEWGTDPLDNDTDGDFLTDGDEVNITSTDPTDPDTDDDGLGDSNEIPNDADPNEPDTDGDGFLDGDEVGAGSDPSDPASTP
jgi:hypothetical protein